MNSEDMLRYRNILIAYLFQKACVADWHGVSDAANDLRELESAHPFLTGHPVESHDSGKVL